MKKTWVFRISLLILFQGILTVQAQEGHEMKFRTGLKDTLCYLANYYGDKQYLQDSAKTDQKGQVIFKGKEKLPGGIYLFVYPNKTYFEVLVDQDQHFTMECDQADIIGSMKVQDSEDNTLFYKYLQFIQQKSKEVEPLKAERKLKEDAKENTEELNKKIRAIDQAVIDYKKDFITQHPGTLLSKIFLASQEIEIPEAPLLPSGEKDSTFAYKYYKAHYFDNLDLADDRLLRTPIYHNRVSSYLKNMVLQHPDSLIKEADWLVAMAKPNKETFKYIVWYITNTYETSNIMGLDAVFVHMGKNYYTKELAYWVDDATLYKINDRAKQLEPLLLGKKVRNLVLEDTAGVFHSLYNVKADYTVLFFFDPDCGHCKKQTPVLKAVYDKYKTKGVDVYAICTEVEMEKWKSYMKDYDIKWITVADPKFQNNFRHEFDISSTPQIYLLDKDKKIKAKKIDAETLEKILDKEFNQSESKLH